MIITRFVADIRQSTCGHRASLQGPPHPRDTPSPGIAVQSAIIVLCCSTAALEVLQTLCTAMTSADSVLPPRGGRCAYSVQCCCSCNCGPKTPPPPCACMHTIIVRTGAVLHCSRCGCWQPSQPR
jgi:hypothetical protein